MSKKKKKYTPTGLSYPATLKFEEGEFVLYPNAYILHVSGKSVHRIVLDNLAEIDTGIPVTKYYAALAGEDVEVHYRDTNTLHFPGKIKIK